MLDFDKLQFVGTYAKHASDKLSFSDINSDNKKALVFCSNAFLVALQK
jgi:hypothetical protein